MECLFGTEQDRMALSTGDNRGSNMAKKPTIRQLETRMDVMEGQIGAFLTSVSRDMNQVITVVSALLDKAGLLEQVICKSCGTELTYPKLDSVAVPTACPACGGQIDGSVLEEE